jgi:hypothetical protein
VRVSAPCRETALHLASSNGRTEIVRALLEKGADVKAEDNTKCAFSCGLCWTNAACTRWQGCARFACWPSVSAPSRNTALHLASRNGHAANVKALLDKGAAVNAENNDKCAFSRGLVLDGQRQHAPARQCAVQLVVERVGAVQEHGTARGI